MIDSPDIRKISLIGKLCVPIMLLFMFIYFLFQENSWYSLCFVLIFYIIISIVWFFSYESISLLFLKLHIKFMKKHGKLPYSNISTLEFYDDCFIELTENTKTEVKYDAILKIRVNNPKGIYIYSNVIMAYIIPFEVFNSNDEKNKFLDFINQKMSK